MRGGVCVAYFDLDRAQKLLKEKGGQDVGYNDAED